MAEKSKNIELKPSVVEKLRVLVGERMVCEQKIQLLLDVVGDMMGLDENKEYDLSPDLKCLIERES